MIKTAIMLFVITVVIALFVIAVVVVYACCVVAGRSDEAADQAWKMEEEKHRNESTDQSAGRDHS